MSLEEAKRTLSHAWEELERFDRDKDPLRLRNACEKGWLATILATDELLKAFNYKNPESYRERRELLEDLERRHLEVARLGLRDRFGARGYYLHIQGYHEGALSKEEVEFELKKVEEYVRDIESIIKQVV